MPSAEHLPTLRLQSAAQTASGFKWTALALLFVASLYASDAFAHEAWASTAPPVGTGTMLSAP